MGLIYDWYETPKSDDSEETTLHARPFLNGKITTEQVAARIRQRCTLTNSDILAVLESLSEVMGEELCEGRQVYLHGIGYFFPTLKVTDKVTPGMNLRERSRLVQFKGIKFRMDRKLEKAIGSVKLTSTHHTSHSRRLTDGQIESLLVDYFATHETMTRRAFQSLCGLTQATAITRLRALREAGRLRNIGTRTQPVYVLAGQKEALSGTASED